MGSRGLHASYQQCAALCLPGDAVLLMGRHVWMLQHPAFAETPPFKLYALAESISAAGLNQALPPHVEIVDWQQVLDLLEREYPLQQTWV